jgi:hypothetical protein
MQMRVHDHVDCSGCTPRSQLLQAARALKRIDVARLASHLSPAPVSTRISFPPGGSAANSSPARDAIALVRRSHALPHRARNDAKHGAAIQPKACHRSKCEIRGRRISSPPPYLRRGRCVPRTAVPHRIVRVLLALATSRASSSSAALSRPSISTARCRSFSPASTAAAASTAARIRGRCSPLDSQCARNFLNGTRQRRNSLSFVAVVRKIGSAGCHAACGKSAAVSSAAAPGGPRPRAPLIHHKNVRGFQQSRLHVLHVVAQARHHQHQRAIRQARDVDFVLSHAHRLDQHDLLPAASRTRAASAVACASPPRKPRVAIERMKTPASAACPCMRMRSPRIAPPVKGLVGSTARIPTVWSLLR